MTSHHLRARAALHSLHIALDQLADRATAEARAIDAQRTAAAEPLKSPSWGRRYALGGHGDPTGDAVLTIGEARPNQYAEQHTEAWEQLHEVAQHLPVQGFNPLDRIETALPAMSQKAAEATRTLLDRIDQRVRRLLKISDDRQLLPGVACPVCDTAGVLALRTSAPETECVVECGSCPQAWPAKAMRGRQTT